MSSNAQQDHNADQQAVLGDLEGVDNRPKTLSAEDRAALNSALLDQETITLLEATGTSS
ncbi:hypothetical protein BJY01DRAFT_219950 [Aspergillus pseudoustus]|uniref:Uncharacterized protein n=1 Tax=Aspergillus pseudoustus TaxID=1810923 RepID=A0ABR4JEX3_9EURO